MAQTGAGGPSVRMRAKLARAFGVPRSTSYYQPDTAKPEAGQQLLERIQAVMAEHPAYGHKRIALELGVGKNRIRRLMKTNGLQPRLRRKTWRPGGRTAQDKAPAIRNNLIATVVPKRPGHIWASDFTYLKFHGKWYYLATVIDVFTRRIVGWQLGARHTATLIHQAVCEVLSREPAPLYVHSDQGSEYTAGETIRLLEATGARVSFSAKGSPWQNGFQESFYQNFKLELGNPNQYETVAGLYEAIARQVYYYNHTRIHTALKTTPVRYYETYQEKQTARPSVEKVGT